jgi:hypothetical protein
MKTTARKTENVMGKDLKVGDVVIRGGYEWVPRQDSNLQPSGQQPTVNTYPHSCRRPRGSDEQFHEAVVATTGGAVSGGLCGSCGIRFSSANGYGNCNYSKGKNLRKNREKNYESPALATELRRPSNLSLSDGAGLSSGGERRGEGHSGRYGLPRHAQNSKQQTAMTNQTAKLQTATLPSHPGT